MISQSSTRQQVIELWETTGFNAKYIAYKFGLTEQSVRSIVQGIKGPKKEKHALSGYHRAIGMKLIDKRLESKLSRKEFAAACGMSHFRLSDLEKGYSDITITEIVLADLLGELQTLDTQLLDKD